MNWIPLLEAEGFTMLKEAGEILESFGGLTITPRESPEDKFLKGSLQFDPVMAASGEFDRIDYWQDQLGIKLSPLAEGSKGEILLIAQDGRIFSCFDNQLFLDGASFEDAIENTLVVARRKSVEYGQRTGPS